MRGFLTACDRFAARVHGLVFDAKNTLTEAQRHAEEGLDHHSDGRAGRPSPKGLGGIMIKGRIAPSGRPDAGASQFAPTPERGSEKTLGNRASANLKMPLIYNL